MPYDPEKSGDVKEITEKLRKTYKNISDTAARQAIHVLNSVMDSTGDEGKAWASVYSKMNERGLAKNAGVKQDILGSSYYEIKVGGFELQVYPLTQADDDWERTGDGGVRIDMGKDGRGGYALLDKQQFALLMVELKKAAALVEEVHATKKSASQTLAAKVAARYARSKVAALGSAKGRAGSPVGVSLY